MTMRDRFKRGFAISIAVHILAGVVLAIFGLCFIPKKSSSVIEVAVFEASGGHVGGREKQANIDHQKSVSAPQIPTPTEELLTEATEKIVKEENYPQAANNTTSSVGTNTGQSAGQGYGQSSGEGKGVGDGTGDKESANVPAVPPRLIKHKEPVYPRVARNRNIEGTTRIRLLIGTDGSVENVDIVASAGDEALDQAAVDAAEQWLFQPAQNHYGKAIRCYTEIPITFELR
ncbi:MAG: energy transducer TonB [Acidaminococcaceae bacterium]